MKSRSSCKAFLVGSAKIKKLSLMPSRNLLDCLHPNMLYLQQISDRLKLSPNLWFVVKKLPYFLLKFSSADWLASWQRCFGCLSSGSDTRHDWYLFSGQVSHPADLYVLQSFCFQNYVASSTNTCTVPTLFFLSSPNIPNFLIIPVAPKHLMLTIMGRFSILFLISSNFTLV